MRQRRLHSMILGLVVVLTGVSFSPGLADEAGKAGSGPAIEPMKFVGRIVAAVPESRALVVDVPLASDVLRIWAVVTDETRLQADGAAAAFESLTPGARVRINVRRGVDGNEALSVEILGDQMG